MAAAAEAERQRLIEEERKMLAEASAKAQLEEIIRKQKEIEEQQE